MNKSSQLSSTSRMVSYVLKVIVIVSAITGTTISAMGRRSAFMGGSGVFMYFTTQSNIALAIICGIGLYFMLKRREIPNAWYIIKFVGTVSITLTGIVFCFVLAPTMGLAAWNFQNILTHVVVPVLSIVDFFITGVDGDIKTKHDTFVIIPPLLYAIYAGIGYAQNWQFAPGYNYPYFFLNWGSPAGAFGFCRGLPFMGTFWWIVVLFFFLLAVGYLYLAILNRIKRKVAKQV